MRLIRKELSWVSSLLTIELPQNKSQCSESTQKYLMRFQLSTFLKTSVLNQLQGYNCRNPQLVIMVNYLEIFKHFATYARSHFPRQSLVKAINRLYPCFPFKVIPLFCTAHPLLRITLLHPRWRRFFPLARKEQTRPAFTELKLLFAIIMPQIGWQLPGLLSKNKKMKEMCVIPNSAVVFHFAAVEW